MYMGSQFVRTVSQHAQYQELETEAAKWNLIIIIILFFSPAVACQNIYSESGLW